MSKINTNMAGVTTLYHLRNKEEGMNKALERISSGLRLNHAVDDAAGASIVNRMTSQIKGLEAAIRNAADAISLTQTAEGAIEEVTSILHRMRELAVQSANGVYTGQDRQAIQNEVGALQEELHRIAESSTFNGVKMLNGSFLDTTFQVGFQPNDTATLSIEDVKPTGLGEYILKTHNTNAANMLTVEKTASTGTTSGLLVNDGTRAVSVEEAFEIGIPAITPASRSNAFELFADTYTGGTYSLSGTDAAAFQIAADGAITSTTMQQFIPGGDNERVIIRTYTQGENVFNETITITLTEAPSGSQTTVRAASTEIDVEDLEGLVINSLGNGAQTGATAGSLSSNLAAFVNAQRTQNSADGAFALSGSDAGLFAVNENTGQITYTGTTNLISDKNLTLTFTSANGDTFVETITIDHDSSHASFHETTLNVREEVNSGSATRPTIDVSTVGSLSAKFSTTFAATAGASVQFDNGTANASGAALAGTVLTLGVGAAAGSPSTQLNIGDFVQYKIQILDAGSNVVHTEDVSFTVGVNPAGVGNTTTRLADNGAGTQTVANSAGIATPSAPSPDPQNTPASNTPTDGTNNQINNAVTVTEGARAIIATTAQSSNLQSVVTANPGGTFTLAGSDAALFNVNATTGEIKSKSFLDFEGATDTGADNVYNITLVYTKDSVQHSELFGITVTNDTADDSVTDSAGRPRLGTDRTTASSLINEEEDLTIYGNVGTKIIDVNGGSTAYEIVQAINSAQGETGVYAAAQTRVNLDFPAQDQAFSDTVTFSILGKNEEAITVSATVDFGIIDGRDANVRDLADAINSSSGKTGITAKVSPRGDMIHMFSNEGYDIVVENFTMSVLDIPMNVSPTNDQLESIGTVQQLRKGTGNNDTFRSTGQITFHSPYIFSVDVGKTGIDGGGLFQVTPGAANLISVASLDVLSVDSAKKMLTAVDGALVRIDLERSDLGAVMSRMEHTINNLSNIVVNTKAARSRIQDADIAEETTEMTKAQVLSQAAQSMLAQANRTSQSILTLLQG